MKISLAPALLLLLLFFFYQHHSSPNLNFKNALSSFVDATSLAPSPSPSLSMEFNSASSNFTLVPSPQKEKKKNRIDEGLAKSRAAIPEAMRWKKFASDKEETFIPRGAVYRNAFAFHQIGESLSTNPRVFFTKSEDGQTMAATISSAIRKQTSSVSVAMKVAVIGSGISGAVCASTLARNGVSVTIFESGRGPGEHMSQRREIGEDGKELMFDHGAPFFCVSNSDAVALVHEWESRGFVSEWKQVFRSFDFASNKFLGIQQEGDAKKYVGVPGMNTISKALCHKSGIESMFGTGIAKLEWLEEEIPWLLKDSSGDSCGSTPAPL